MATVESSHFEKCARDCHEIHVFPRLTEKILYGAYVSQALGLVDGLHLTDL